MADFGLAAQIGRGGAGGGVQQVDPANRMMQMMQLQQTQQNMMLQQELAARQRQLFPLEQKKLQEAIRTQTYLGDTAGVKSREAKRAENVYTRLLRLRQTTDPAALSSPEFRTALATRDPELADQLNSIVSGAEKTKLELQTAGYNKKAAEEASKKAMFSAIASTLPGIVDQSTFDAVLGEVERVDPLTVKLTGRRFTPGAKRILEKRLRGLADIKIEKDPDGNWVRIDPDANTKTVLRSEEPAPAPPQLVPAFGTGGLSVVQPSMPMSPDLAQRAAAATPVPTEAPGPAPIIQPRAPAPAAPPAATAETPLGPAASAEAQKTAAREQAKADVARREKSIEKQEARKSVQDTLDGMVDAYKRLAELNALQTPGMTLAQRATIAGRARLPTDVATVLSPEIGAELTAMSNLRQSLIPVLTELMGARSVDAVKEMEAMVASLTSGGQAPSAIARTINNFSKKYGLGISVDPKDITPRSSSGRAKSPAGAPAVGAVENGYRFKGGDPSVPANWEKL